MQTEAPIPLSAAQHDLNSRILAKVHEHPAFQYGHEAPEGAASFPMPGLAVLPLVQALTNLALSSLAKTYGGTAEDYVASHRDQILAIVPGAVIDAAAGILTTLQTSGK